MSRCTLFVIHFFLKVLEVFMDILPVLQKQEGIPGKDDNNVLEGSETGEGLECTSTTANTDIADIDKYLLRTLLQRIQATLLALYKLMATKQLPKKGKEAAVDAASIKYKQLYSESLKANESAPSIIALLRSIQAKEK